MSNSWLDGINFVWKAFFISHVYLYITIGITIGPIDMTNFVWKVDGEKSVGLLLHEHRIIHAFST